MKKEIGNTREPADTLDDNSSNWRKEFAELLVPAIICLTSAIVVSLAALDLHSGHHSTLREDLDFIGVAAGVISTYISGITLLGKSGMSL